MTQPSIEGVVRLRDLSIEDGVKWLMEHEDMSEYKAYELAEASHGIFPASYKPDNHDTLAVKKLLEST
jgi:hypothetical protein